MENDKPYIKVEQQGDWILVYYYETVGYRIFSVNFKEAGLLVKKLKENLKSGKAIKIKTQIHDESPIQIRPPKEILPKLIEMLEQEWKYATGKQKRPVRKKYTLNLDDSK